MKAVSRCGFESAVSISSWANILRSDLDSLTHLSSKQLITRFRISLKRLSSTIIWLISWRSAIDVVAISLMTSVFSSQVI